CARNYHAMDYW
nr:immunoglobulin heavy chain junction region [Mus musculus]